MKQLIAAFSLIFLAVSATALASPTNVRFAHLDKNMDGKISISEATQDKVVMKQFADLDKNDDDMISKSEFGSFKP
jgi:hypothetical protein